MDSLSSQFTQYLEQPQNSQASELSSFQYAPPNQQAYRLLCPSSTQFSQAYQYPYTHQYQVPTQFQEAASEVPSKLKKNSKPKKVTDSIQKKRTGNFNAKEDDALVKSWIVVSGDGIIGNSQSRTNLWERIYNAFNDLLGIEQPNEDDDRTPNSLGCRWRIIQQKVNKFVGYFSIVDRNPRSGTTFDDRVEEAKKTFRSMEGQDFNLEEAWKLLRDNPKFNEKNVASKKRKNLDDSHKKSSHTSSSSPVEQANKDEEDANITNDDGVERPEMGRKKSKERKKRTTSGEGSSAVIKEFICKFEESLKQQYILSEKEIESKQDMIRKDLELKERHLQQKAQDFRLKQWLAEKDILEKNLAGMAPHQVEFFQKLQHDIWDKWQRDGTGL